jgi:ABC-type transport system involved in multi-copper enzyme maturation permease subunit
MDRVLYLASLRDGRALLASCCALTTLFVALRVWIASHIEFAAFVTLFSEGLKFFQNLLPVPIEELASPLGRVAFSYEEGPTLLLLGLWTVARGTECIAGRVGAGTMEMLLAQPVRRLAVVGSHTAATLTGVAAISVAAWCGAAAGTALSKFAEPPSASQLLPATVNYVGLGVFIVGAATLVSSLARSRSQAVGLVIGFYVVQLTLMIMSRLSPQFAWLHWLTILSAYEPTLLTLGLVREPAAHWPLFWAYNAWLFGLGALTLAAAAAIFCRRDVPAPL